MLWEITLLIMNQEFLSVIYVHKIDKNVSTQKHVLWLETAALSLHLTIPYHNHFERSFSSVKLYWFLNQMGVIEISSSI